MSNDKRATFRIVYFPQVDRYIAIAWNYDAAILISTRDHATYTGAREELYALVSERGVVLQWFDGEYSCDGSGILGPLPTSVCAHTIGGKCEACKDAARKGEATS